MNVQHLTLGGNSVVRDTSDILPEARKKLSILSLAYENQTVSIPDFPFRVKITADGQGAIFDLSRGEDLLTTNVCCFHQRHSKQMLGLVWDLSEKLPYTDANPKQPESPFWIYSVVLNPFVSPELITIAGEVELYVYEQLYTSQKSN